MKNYLFSFCKKHLRVRLRILGLLLPVVLGVEQSQAGDIVWTNLAGGNWSSATNWNPHQVPAAGDNAYITNSGTYTVTFNASVTVASLVVGGTSGTQTFTNSGSTLTLNGTSTVGANGVFSQSGGALAGAGDLAVNGPLIWTGGTLSGAGTIFANGSLNISNAASKTLSGRTLVNSGNALWSAGTILLASSGVISNTATGTFDCAFDGSLSSGGGSGQAVMNTGLFRKTAGTGVTTINNPIAFNNAGTVEVQTGTLGLGGGGTSSGNFKVPVNTTLDLPNGTHNLTGGVSGAGRFSVSGATLNLAGLLGVTGTNLFSGGTANLNCSSFAIDGSVVVISGGIANFNGSGAVSAALLNVSGGNLGGSNSLSFAGALTWIGGGFSGTSLVSFNGGAISSATSKSLSGRTLVNLGSVSWSGGTILIASSGTLSNAATGTFDCAFDGAMSSGGGSGQAINNAGLFRKTAGPGASAINNPIAFNNLGTVEVQSGTLSLGGGGTSIGNFNVPAKGTLDFPNGTHNLNGGISGAGALSVSGSTLNLAGSLGVTGTNIFSGGTANLNCSSFSIDGSVVVISGGIANFNGSGAVSAALLNMSGGNLGGSNSLSFAGALTWSGGGFSGTNSLSFNGGTIANNTSKSLTGRTLVNLGSVSWSGGTILIASSGTFSNAATGTFDCAFDGAMSSGGGSGQAINNAGLFRKTAGPGASAINNPIAFNNVGTVEVQSGTLSLGGGGTSIGNFNVPANGTLDFPNGTHNLNGGISGAGALSVSGSTLNLTGPLGITGTNLLSGGTANLNCSSFAIDGSVVVISGGIANFNGSGGVTAAQLTVSSGTLGGSNSIGIAGSLKWTGGGFSGTNQVSFNGGLISTTTSKSLSGRTLVNLGPMLWSAGTILISSSGTLSNAATGTFDCAFDGNISSGGGSGQAINNAGLFRKTAGTGVTAFNTPIAFNNAGTVEVQTGTLTLAASTIQTAGLTLLDGGNLTLGLPLQLLGGVLGGTNLVTGNVTNSSLVSPGASFGLLSIAGNYVQTTNGSIAVEIAGTAPGINFDALSVSGNARLAGAVKVTLTNGFYPATNAAFTFLTAGTRSNTFSTLNYPSNDVGMTLTYTPSNATIQVINVRPVIQPIPDQVINEMALFTLTVLASDDDRPAQTLTYSLTNSPAGATIDTNGLISWIPTEAQGPMVTNLTVLVTDDGSPNLTVSRTFQVTVNEINVPPLLTLPPNQTLDELTTLSVYATGSDSDIPANPLTYVLVSAPPGMAIDPVSGLITWTPTEAQGPGNYVVQVSVTDTNLIAVNTQSLSVTNSFTVNVNEVNLPPMLTVPPAQVINELTVLTVTNTATDPDIPFNLLSYSIVSGPSNAVINSATGVLTFSPDESQGPSTNVFTVRVTDNGVPPLSDTRTFTVVVNEVNLPPVLALPANTNINELVAYSAQATATDSDVSTNPLTFALVSGPVGLTVSSSGLIQWTPTEAQGPSTNSVIISVSDTNQYAVNAKSLSVTNSYQIMVNEVNLAPVLSAISDKVINAGATITFTNHASDSDLPANVLSFSLVNPAVGATLGAASGVFAWRAPISASGTTNLVSVVVADNGVPSLSATQSFRIFVNPLTPVELTGAVFTNGLFQFMVTGPIGPDYALFASTNVALPFASWTSVGAVTPTNSPFLFMDPMSASVSNRVYRVRLGP